MTKPQNLPICSECQYDLTGSPTENDMYSCPECGHQLAVDDAHTRPYYIKSTTKPMFLASIPPAILLVLFIVPPFLLPTANARANYCAPFILFAPITLLWPFLIAMNYAIKTEKYKGPDRRRGPFKAFFSIWLSASMILGCALILTWLLAFAIFAGSSF